MMKNTTLFLMIVCFSTLNSFMGFSQSIHEPYTTTQEIQSISKYSIPTDALTSLFFEDFSSGTFPPADWTIEGDSDDNWSVELSNNAGGIAPEVRFNWSPEFVGNSRLITPMIATSGNTSLLLSFRHFLDDFGGPDDYTIFIESTSDGGTTWNEVWSLADPGSNVDPEQVFVIVNNDDVGSDEFQIAFRFDGDSYELNWWNLDDVMLNEPFTHDVEATTMNLPTLVTAGDDVTPKGLVTNLGTETESFSVNFSIEEQGGGALVYSEDITITDLASYEAEALTFPVWTSEEGDYDAAMTVSLTDDENPDNNQLTQTISAVTGAFPLKPLFEMFTSSTCGPCVYGNEVLDGILENNPGTHSIIKYQMNWPGSGDPYYTQEGGVRKDYYGVLGVPDLFINSDNYLPSTLTQSIYDSYQGLTTELGIEIVTAVIDDDFKVTVMANIDVLAEYEAGLTAHVAVLEKETVGNVGTNGETEFSYVMMKMFPDAAGTSLPALSPGTTETLLFDYDMTLTHMEEPDDLAVIVFVQDDADQSVHQSEMADVEGDFESWNITFAIADADGNPVNNAEVWLEANGIQFTNELGQTIFEGVYTGIYDYEITAVGLLPTSGTVEMVDEDVTETVVLEFPDYYFFEPFDTGIPTEWIQHVVSPDMIYWYDGEVLLFDQSVETDTIMLVSPLVNIEDVSTLYFDLGQQNDDPILFFGTVSDPDDPATFVEYAAYTAGEPMSTYDFDLTQIPGDEVYFAWFLDDIEGSWVVLDNVIIYSESGDAYNVTVNVSDPEGNPVEGAEVYLAGQGTLITNSSGVAVYQNVYAGSYIFNVYSEGLVPYSGDVEVVDEDVTVDVELEGFYFYESFDDNIPSDWSSHVTTPDLLYWFEGQVIYHDLTATDDPIILVSPAFNISNLTSMIIETGTIYNNPILSLGTLSDPTDPATFTELESIQLISTWELHTIDLTNYSGTDSYFGFKHDGPQTAYFSLFSVGLLGSDGGTVLYEDDFESYNAGEQLACQNPDDWTTWSEDPCSAEDPNISSAQASSGSNSVEITGTNDLVYVIDNLTSGSYTVNFQMYVPAGNDGYFNTLQEFNGASSQWGMQVYFDAGGAGSIDGGGTAAATFSFNYDEWMDIKIVVDLNADWAEFYHNDELIHEWIWSSGTGGTSSLNQLGGVNFFAWAGSNGSPLYFFDDFNLEQAVAMEPPTNLTATIVDDNDVELSWDAPIASIIGYNVYRDGMIIEEEILETTYTDYDLLPGTYAFDVKAVYAIGISAGAGPVEATIEGGTDRDLVILEIGTGTWCTFCPGAAMGADELIENGHDVGVIEYHGGDDYETLESGYRLDTYYGITGYPTAWFDGIITHVGGNATQSIYETYLGYYEQRIDVVSLYTLDAEVVYAGGTSWEVLVDAEMIYPYPGDDVVLQVVLIESHIQESWFNQTEINFVCRDMVPDQFGTEMDFDSNPQISVNLDLEIPNSYELENCEVVVFLQDNDTKEVMQGTRAELSVGMNEHPVHSLNLYPNPASEQVRIESNKEIIHLQVFNQTGGLVLEKNIRSDRYTLDVQDFTPGMYLILIETSGGIQTEGLMVR